MANPAINNYARVVSDEKDSPEKAPAGLSTGEALIFSAKAAVSAVAALVCLVPFQERGKSWTIWAPVSAVIVTQAKLHPSLQLSLLRVKANLIGAGIGAIAGMITGHPVLALCVGVFAAGMACHFLKLEDAARPAYAAVVIVTLANNEPHGWAGSLDRVLGVLLGCVIAVAVGLVFDFATRSFTPKTAEEEKTGKGLES
jgi:uncharacterized membrane protein YgaE (UPF0421/DUF939 family)